MSVESEKRERQEKKLIKKQLALLLIVYRFRFVTIGLVMSYEGQKHHESVRRRLDELVSRGLLFKRTNNHYIIDRRPAEYTLTPAAIPILRSFPGNSERELRRLYARQEASERFVAYSLGLFTIRNELARIYGQRMSFFAKPQLNVDDYDYFPSPLPDAFITLDSTTTRERHFFAEFFDDSLSIGLHGRKIASYMSYKNDGEWDGTGLHFPTVLIICQSLAMCRKAEKRIRYLEQRYESEVSFYLIDLDSLQKVKTDGEMAWMNPLQERQVSL